MYICICNAITEKEVENIIDAARVQGGGQMSAGTCMMLMGKYLKCGKCEETFEEKIRNYYAEKNAV